MLDFFLGGRVRVGGEEEYMGGRKAQKHRQMHTHQDIHTSTSRVSYQVLGFLVNTGKMFVGWLLNVPATC